MEACLIIGGVLLTLGVIAVLAAVLRPLSTPTPPAERRREPPHRRFEFCPACDAPVVPSDRSCPACRLNFDGRLAGRLERVRVARDEIGRLGADGHLDPETVERVTEQLDRRKQQLLRPEERPARPTAPPPLPRERREPVSPPAVRDPLVGERPPGLPELAPAGADQPRRDVRRPGKLQRLWGANPPAEQPATPRVAEPRRSLAEVFGQYMHERNILWGELAGGLLIVGCSIALVLSLWRTLEELPYFTFLLFAGITGAVFAAGWYTLHHWKLTATSRGLLVIALLLAPLNLLLLADPGAKGITTAIDTVFKVAAVLAFAGLVRTGGRDLVGTDALPGWIPRRWLLALAVVGPPASQMVPAVADAGVFRYVPVWLALACFAGAGGAAVGRQSRDQRRSTEPLGERPAVAVLLFVGLGLFALLAAWGFLLARAEDLPATLRHLALPAVMAGIPVLSAGLLVQRRLIEPVGLRATGTGVALAGIMVLIASLVLAWPDAGMLLATAAAVAVLLGWIAYHDELPWMYAGAMPSAALAVVLAYHAATGAWAIPEGSEPGRWLAELTTAPASGAVLVGFALLLGLASELWVRRGRRADALGYAIGAAGVAAAGLLVVTLHGIERPALSAWAHVAAAAGFIAASFRWRFRTVAQVGVWLVLVASIWSLWAVRPDDRGIWGLAIGVESLALAVTAVGLGFVETTRRLRDACRDVGAAAAILAPLISLASVPTSTAHTGMLFAVVASAFVLAGLYRQAAITWVGSLTACVAVVHWLAFPAGLQPWHGAVLLGLLIHASAAITASLLLPADRDRGRGLYAEPFRLSGRLTSALALPLLLFPAAGLAPAWVGMTVWAGGLWLIAAFAWREPRAFPAFQLALTWAAGLAGFAWVERQDWFAASRFGTVDPRALQAYGVAIGILSIAWTAVRRVLRTAADVCELWAEWRPSVDQVVLGGLVVVQLLLAAPGVLPAVVAEVTPTGAGFVPPVEAAHFWGPGAWVLLGVMLVAVVGYLRWPAEETEPATAPVVGLTLLGLTVPFLLAGAFSTDMAAASALRWGMAAVFLAGSVAVAFREPVGRWAERLGFRSIVHAYGPALLRGLLAVAAGIVLLLTARVAELGFSGLAPSGPAPQSVFSRMGWTASVVIPLAVVVAGLAVTALRERSAGYAFAGGWVWTATLAGGYALGVVASGGALGPSEWVRVGLLAAGGVAVWAIAWLSVEERVPGRGLLTAQTVVGLIGMMALAVVPFGLLLTSPGQPLGPGSERLGQEGWVALVLAALAALWHAHRAAPAWRLHVIGVAVVLSGVLAACTAAPWDGPGKWLSIHVLAVWWGMAGSGLAAVLLAQRPAGRARPRLGDRLWPEVLAVGLVLLGLRGGWSDPLAPFAPAGAVLLAAIVFGAVALRLRSRPHEYVSGALAALAGALVWVSWGAAGVANLALTLAIALSQAGAVWAAMALAWRAGSVTDRGDDPDYPGDDLLGLPPRPREMLPPFPHFAAAVSLGFVLYGLFPALSSLAAHPWLLAWGAVAATAVVLVVLVWDRQAPYAAAGLYVLGVAAVGLGLVEARRGLVWVDWATPLVFAGYVLGASLIAVAVHRGRPWREFLRWPERAPGEVREWLVFAQTVVGLSVIGLAVRSAIAEPDVRHRLAGPVAVLLLVPAAVLLTRTASAGSARWLRPATLWLGAVTLGVLAWAVPDPAGPVPWLHRHGGLFVALAAAAVVYSLSRASGSWAGELRRVGGMVGVVAVAVLVMFLVQQIPHFNPDLAVRKTPLEPVTVFAVIGAIVALIILAIHLALRPDRDPLGPTPQGRPGYVYLAEVLLVLLFVHVRLNVPQVFVAEAVKLWTFIVMLLAFIGVGLAEWFARRGVRVLSRPLLRTGVLLPLIPLLAFWAKPPALVMEFAKNQAPGLQPMLGYLDKLPQHFDMYALLWFLAGLLYGLIALNRRSFGWALLGALATNAGLWALLSHHQVPAAVHPQAWAIPLALIILVSEHVNRYRLRAETAAGLRYLGISMIYVSSAADLFIAGIGQSLWLPVILAALCLAGVVAGVLLRVRAFLYLGIGFLMLDVFSMIWHAAVDRAQTWVWYASGIVLGAIILALFAVLEKRRNDVRELVGRLREWNA